MQYEVVAEHRCRDEEGMTYVVAERRMTASHSGALGKETTSEGTDYILHQGAEVKKVSDDVFEVVSSGKRLRRIG